MDSKGTARWSCCSAIGCKMQVPLAPGGRVEGAGVEGACESGVLPELILAS